MQRAHQNTLENIPLLLALLLFGSLGFPAISAGAGFLWIISRVFYAVGYYAAPKSRIFGAVLSYVGTFTLVGVNIAFVVYLFKAQDPIPWK